MPTPASPTTVTSSQDDCVSARSHACRSAAQLARATDEARRVRALRRPRNREQPERRHRLRLPLQRQRLHRLDHDRPLHERQRRLADQHLARLGRLLQPRRDVDGVTGRQPLLGPRDDLARVDADPAVDPELRERVPHLHRRPARAQRVVLVRRRHAEHRHHRVADELLHRAAVRLDDRLHPLEVARQQRPQRLRVGRLAQRRRTGDVAEQHRDGLADFARDCRRRKPRATAVAKARPDRVLPPATRADEHELRLRHRDAIPKPWARPFTGIDGSRVITGTTRVCVPPGRRPRLAMPFPCRPGKATTLEA